MGNPKRAIRLRLLLGIFFLAQPALATTVKTYYKQYSIFTFENQDYLCEPYQVQKNDWLYKIFRQKGEISAQDFPRFLMIFRELNPKLSNIDAIEPGHQILIPLKRVDRKTYVEEQGIVQVPVVEFSSDPKDRDMAAYVQSHTVQEGDTVSTLLDKTFLKKGGSLSPLGEEILKKLNPDLTDVNRIYLGSRIVIPDPSMLAQPWFQAFLTGAPGTDAPAPTMIPAVPLPQMSPQDLSRLERYARLVQGVLQHQGTMVFPGKNGGPAQVLDLTKTPLLTTKNNEKTLILPTGSSENQISQDLLTGMQAYWNDLRIQEFNKALAASPLLSSKGPSLDEIAQEPQGMIQQVAQAAGLVFSPPAPFPIDLGPTRTEASMARVNDDKGLMLLINPGIVYGSALQTLEAQGQKVLTLSPGMTYGEILLLLFTKLDFTTWKNPAFNDKGQVTPLEGIYAVKEKTRLFVTRTALPDQARAFLQSDGITSLVLIGETP